MPYVAHVGVQLANDEQPREKNVWHTIKKVNDIEYRWIFNSDYTYQIIAGVFLDPNEALQSAKQLYVTLFYTLFRNDIQIADAGCDIYVPRLDFEGVTVDGYNGSEPFFFWNKHYQGGKLGPGVFEVESSLDEFNEYQFLSAKLIVVQDSNLSFSKIDQYLFTYCKEAQDYFNTILIADNTWDFGMKMTIYCSLLEHLAESRDKEADVLSVIDELVDYVNKTTLSNKSKESLKNFIKSGRKESSLQRCYALCEKYAKQKYGQYECKKIIREAYSIRSAFAHGENCRDRYSSCAAHIKVVLFDVILNYMREKEKATHA